MYEFKFRERSFYVVEFMESNIMILFKLEMVISSITLMFISFTSVLQYTYMFAGKRNVDGCHWTSLVLTLFLR